MDALFCFLVHYMLLSISIFPNEIENIFFFLLEFMLTLNATHVNIDVSKDNNKEESIWT